MPGFVGAYFLADRGSGEGVTFTFWEGKDALEASRSPVDQLRTPAAAETGTEVVGVDHFEVVHSTGDKIHRSATHALVREFGVDPAKLEASVEMAKSNLLPALRELPGFQGGFYVADRTTGKVVTVLFVAEASLEATRERWEQVRTASRAAQVLSTARQKVTASEPRLFEVIARALTRAEKAS
jgi:heme-degrading monooxygenase HmoA